MHPHLALVVDRTAGVEGTVALLRFERGRQPFVERIDRLDVVVAVDECGGQRRVDDPLRVQGGVARGREQLGAGETGAERAHGEVLGGSDDVASVRRVGGDAGDPAGLDQLLDEARLVARAPGVEVRVNGRGGHRRASMPRLPPAAPCHHAAQPGVASDRSRRDRPAGDPAVFRLRRPRGRRPLRRRRERGGGPSVRLGLPLALAAGVVWAYLPVSALAASVPPAHRPAAQPGLPWLSVAGADRIVDEQGRTVLLRGFNSDALLEDGVRHASLDETDAALMQSSGFDVVRLPIAWSRLEPERGRIDRSYLDEIAATVAMLNHHGMYVVLDMHFLDWGPRFGGTGAPSWAALPGVPSLQWWPWESWRKHLDPAQNAATTYFWIAPDWQADYRMVWQAVADRFRDDSGIAEPHPLPIPPRLFESHWLWPLYARTVEAIGSVDPNHLFIVEGVLFGDYGTTIVPLRAPNLVYSPHIYTGSLVPPAFTGDRGPLDSHIHDQAAEARAVPAPLWTGELGIDHRQPHAGAYADAALDAYDDLEAGWAWWQWREDSWGVRSADGRSLDGDFLRHVARPYLVAAPAWVRGGHGDGIHGALRISVAAGHAGSRVVVAWPQPTLGAPRVGGAAACARLLAWDESTARLELDLDPGSCTVTLTAR